MRLAAVAISLAVGIGHAVHSDPPTHDTECRIRELLYEYSLNLQPERAPMVEVFDSLEQHTMCGQTRPVPKKLPPASFDLPAEAFFVDASAGDDAASGSKTAPFRTVSHAVDATHSQGAPKAVVLRAGTHFLKQGLDLTSVDNGLVLMNFPGEEAWLSGGVQLKTAWTKVAQADWHTSLDDANIYVTDVEGIEDFTGLMTLESQRRLTRARYPNANPEDRTTVKNLGQRDGVQKYLAPKVKPAAEQVWIDLTKGPQIYNFSTMDVYNGYANGYCKSAGDPNCPCGSWKDVRDGKWESASYHCAKKIGGGWENMDQGAGYYNGPVLPLGVIVNGSLKDRLDKWSSPEGGIVVAWRAQGWFVNMYEISSVDKSAGVIHWADENGMPQGGWQGGRGWQINGSTGDIDPTPPFYVENVKEELDAPDEWFFDKQAKKLYLYYSGVGAPTGGFVATQLKEIIGIRGSKSQPAQNITIQGLGFRDAAATFMEPWGVPSGGDWAFYRGAAVFIQGAKDISVRGNVFKRVDGNAITLSGYTRDVQLVENEFYMIGDNAMAAWGYTDENDGTGGEQPRRTIVSKNFAYELGIFQLQSSMWFQAKAAQTTIDSNLFFNGPRAGINFNDGFGGGNIVSNNAIWNQCRQSGDHGPINSWDRQIFLTDVRDGTPSYIPAMTQVHHNFIIANYGGSQGFDNDDGSSWYDIHDNFIYGEGLKQDYGGHDSSYTNNLNVVHRYDGQNCFNTWTFVPGHEHVFKNNTCVMLFDSYYADFQGDCKICKGLGPEGRCLPDLANNAYYTPNGTVNLKCGNSETALVDIQKLGSEVGSTAGTKPSDDKIISWARSLLSMAPPARVSAYPDVVI